MESAQRALVDVLLGRLRALDLISGPVYSGAVDLVYAGAQLPGFFRDPACLTQEADQRAGPPQSAPAGAPPGRT